MLITEYVFKHACNHAHYSVHLYRKPLETTHEYYNTIALGKEPHKTTRSLYFLVLLSFISVTVFCCMFIFIMARCMVELVLRELHKFIFRFQAKSLPAEQLPPRAAETPSVVAQQLTSGAQAAGFSLFPASLLPAQTL